MLIYRVELPDGTGPYSLMGVEGRKRIHKALGPMYQRHNGTLDKFPCTDRLDTGFTPAGYKLDDIATGFEVETDYAEWFSGFIRLLNRYGFVLSEYHLSDVNYLWVSNGQILFDRTKAVLRRRSPVRRKPSWSDVDYGESQLADIERLADRLRRAEAKRKEWIDPAAVVRITRLNKSETSTAETFLMACN